MWILEVINFIVTNECSFKCKCDDDGFHGEGFTMLVHVCYCGVCYGAHMVTLIELGKGKMVDLLYPQSKILFDYNFLFIEFTITKNYFKFNLSHTLGLEITKSSLLNLLIEGFLIIPRAFPNFLKRNFLYLSDSFMTKSLNIQYLCTIGT